MKTAWMVVAVVLAVALGGLGWMGTFSSVKVVETDMGPYSFAFVQDTASDPGAVADQVKAFDERLEAAGFTQRRPAQVYFPAGGAQNQFGFVVDRTVTVDILGSNAFFMVVPPQRFTVARFPYRNGLSYTFGDGKALGALAQYRKEKGYPAAWTMVIREGDSIVYLQPVQG